MSKLLDKAKSTLEKINVLNKGTNSEIKIANTLATKSIEEMMAERFENDIPDEEREEYIENIKAIHTNTDIDLNRIPKAYEKEV